MTIPFRPLVEVLTKAVRDAGLTQINDDDLREWALFAIREIGAYTQFLSKREKLPVVEFKALLPQDFYRIDESKFSLPCRVELDCLVVSQKTGFINLDYLALPIDEEGNLLVPDESTYESAISWYIYSRLCLQGRFPNTSINYDYANNKWLVLKNAARAELDRLGLQAMQQAVTNRNSLRFGFGTSGMRHTRRS